MPVASLDGFGPRASMSFFMYNQDGTQAIARPFFDGQPPQPDNNASPGEVSANVLRMHMLDRQDVGTNAPSENFIYQFDEYRYLVRDEWRQVLAHDAGGRVTGGSLEALTDAFAEGREIKVAIAGLCAELSEDPEHAVRHELMVHCGPGWNRRGCGAGSGRNHLRAVSRSSC